MAVLTGVGVFLFYFSNNLVYWLYSLKQWAISVQVPKLISEQAVWLTPRKYNDIKTAGIVVDFVVVAASAVSRFFLWRDVIDNKQVPSIIALNVDLMFATEACLLVSVVLMIDTLRRLKKSFVQNPYFLENQRTMRIQVITIAVHLTIEIVLIELIEYSDVHHNSDRLAINIFKIILVLVLLSGQVILFYLLE